MNMTDTLGWVATALLVASVSQTHMMRLRLLSTAASVAWVIYGLMLGSYPLVVTNSIIAAVNVWQMHKFRAAQKSEATSTPEVTGETLPAAA